MSDEAGVSVESLTDPAKDGFLTKRGGSIKTWKKRWFVLKDGKLYYFKGKSDATPQGTIVLEQKSQCGETALTTKKHAFQVETSTRIFVITATSDEERAGWMEAIKKAIENLPGASDEPAAATSPAAATDASPTSGGESAKPADDEPATTPAPAAAAGTPRAKLSNAKDSIPFLKEEESKVLEFWQIWSESIPAKEDIGAGMAIEFHVSISASLQKLTWRTAGPQNIFIQRMVDFFWNVGAPESEIDRLNDVGALINPIKIGSWIDMSGKGGMDGGWFFPVDITLAQALESADAGDPANKVREWAEKHSIESVYSVGRDMGAAPPRQTEIRIKIPGSGDEMFAIVEDAFEIFSIPKIPDDALEVLKGSSPEYLCLSVITSSEGFVRLGVLHPNPSSDTVTSLCTVSDAPKAELANFEGALGSSGPAWVEYQYLMKGFGYGVYKEGFDIVFHYDVGEESG